MKVRLRLIATYRDYLPPETQGGALELDLPSGSTATDALTRFGVPTGPASVILLNGLSVAPEAPLHDGDELAVFSAVAGG